MLRFGTFQIRFWPSPVPIAPPHELTGPKQIKMAPLGRLTSLIVLIMTGLNLGETLEEAFASGTLERKGGGIVCKCTPGKRYEQGWGPRSSEWKAHRQRELHLAWARAQAGKRKLDQLPAAGPSGAAPREQKRPAAEHGSNRI